MGLPLDPRPPSETSPQLSAQGEGPRLGERAISISPAPPGGLEAIKATGETDVLWERGETGETDLLYVRGEVEQEVAGSWRC